MWIADQMLEFLFVSKSPVKLKLYLKFNLFKCPALGWPMRGGLEKRLIKIIFFFFLSWVKKKKKKALLMSVEDQILYKRIMIICPTWQRRSWNYKSKDWAKKMTKNLTIRKLKQEENNYVSRNGFPPKRETFPDVNI